MRQLTTHLRQGVTGAVVFVEVFGALVERVGRIVAGDEGVESFSSSTDLDIEGADAQETGTVLDCKESNTVRYMGQKW